LKVPIHCKVQQDGRYASKAVYTVLGLNLAGGKDILGLYPLHDRALAKCPKVDLKRKEQTSGSPF